MTTTITRALVLSGLAVLLCSSSAPAEDRSLGAPRWEVIAATPEDYCPQGLAALDGNLYLSAYKGRQASVVFRLDWSTKSFTRLFALPREASHTGGLDFLDAGHLLAADYHANKLYLIDLPKSIETGRAVVLAETRTGLRGTSACCVVEKPRAGGPAKVMVTDFRNSNENVFFQLDLQACAFERTTGERYSNHGYSQGAKCHGGFLYETGNRLTSSYLIRHRLDEALRAGAVQPAARWSGPSQGIEDLAILGDEVYVTDEGTNRLYRLKLPADEPEDRPAKNFRLLDRTAGRSGLSR